MIRNSQHFCVTQGIIYYTFHSFINKDKRMIIAHKQRYNCNGIPTRSKWIILNDGFEAGKTKTFYYVTASLSHGEYYKAKAVLMDTHDIEEIKVFVKEKMRGNSRFGNRELLTEYGYDPPEIVHEAIKASPNIVKPDRPEAPKGIATYTKPINLDWKEQYKVQGLSIPLEFEEYDDTDADDNLSETNRQTENDLLAKLKNQFILEMKNLGDKAKKCNKFDIYYDHLAYRKYQRIIRSDAYKKKVLKEVSDVKEVLPVICEQIGRKVSIYLTRIICKFLVPTYVKQEDLREVRMKIWRDNISKL